MLQSREGDCDQLSLLPGKTRHHDVHCMLISSIAGHMPALVLHYSCEQVSSAQHSSGCTARSCGAWRLAPIACTGSHASDRST